jgi:hypothetical protein
MGRPTCCSHELPPTLASKLNAAGLSKDLQARPPPRSRGYQRLQALLGCNPTWRRTRQPAGSESTRGAARGLWRQADHVLEQTQRRLGIEIARGPRHRNRKGWCALPAHRGDDLAARGRAAPLSAQPRCSAGGERHVQLVRHEPTSAGMRFERADSDAGCAALNDRGLRTWSLSAGVRSTATASHTRLLGAVSVGVTEATASETKSQQATEVQAVRSSQQPQRVE